jgi:hypothetical protein
MPRYLATRHARQRFIERLPGISASLVELAEHAAVVAQQAGMDLMLCVEVGLERVYLPITPTGRGDAWLIKTVLTEAQARANLAERAERSRAAWRARKGFTRPWTRRSDAHRNHFADAA